MVNIKINKKSMFLLVGILLILILVCLPIVLANPSTIYGPDGIAIAQVSEDGIYIYAGDGTEFLILNDSNGNIIYREKVDDSGNILKKEGKLPKNLQLTLDKETGLYWYAYDSTIGTYLRATGVMFKEMATGIGVLFAEVARSNSPIAGLHVLADPNAVTQYEPRIALTPDMIPIYGQIKTIATPMPNENLLNKVLIKGGAVSSLTSTALFGIAGGLKAAGYDTTIWGGGAGCVGGGCGETTAIVKYNPAFAMWQKSFPNVNYIYGVLPTEITRSPRLAEAFMNSKGVVYLGKRKEKLNFLLLDPSGTDFMWKAIGPIRESPSSTTPFPLTHINQEYIHYGQGGYVHLSTRSLFMREPKGLPYIHWHMRVGNVPNMGYTDTHIIPGLITWFEYNKFIKDFPHATLPTGEVVPIRELTNYFLWDPF